MAVLLVLVLFSICLGGCDNNDEYKGKPIKKITYTTIKYFGGYRTFHIIDFENNTYSTFGYFPYKRDADDVPEVKSTFTDEQEIAFLNSAYKVGFLSSKANINWMQMLATAAVGNLKFCIPTEPRKPQPATICGRMNLKTAEIALRSFAA